MASAKDGLLAVVGAVADGEAVDWEQAESTPMSEEDRSRLAQLRVVEAVHRAYRATDIGSSPQIDNERTARISSGPVDDLPAASDTSVITTADSIPSTWGPLEIRGVLGVGGFGVVYRAWDPNLASEVALKVLSREPAGAGPSVIKEARLLARVRHPNIVSIYGADRWSGQIGLWMELVRGRTLKEIIKQQGTLGAREAAVVALALTRALAAVHAAGLVHRDVKPHNVMREDSGRIVLMDFGAGIDLGESGAPQRKYVGTPLYMAPELFDRNQPTPQSDLYSLGILLYHLVTDAYPLAGDTPDAVRLNHLRGERRRLRDARPDLPTEFVRIVERAIDPSVGARYQSAGELEADLAQFVVQDEQLAAARTPSPAAAGPPPRRRPRGAVLIAAAIVAVLVPAGVATVTYGVWHRTPRVVTPAALQSIVVIPLRNATGDPAQDYFVDGMTDLLTADLSGVSALRVIADSAASRYRNTPKATAEIGRELRVDAVVEGSVTRSGERVRVTLQVIHAGTNLSLWGGSFEREAGDAFRLQADITRTLVAQLKSALTSGEQQRLAQVYVPSPEVQDLYLRGRFLMHTFNRDRLVEARAALERAVSLDPNYALAWASLARCYSALQQSGLMSSEESRRLGRAAARIALDRDAAMYEAQSQMAEALFKFDWNWAEADAHYRLALQANPNYSTGRWQYARFLSAAGRVDQAVTEARRAEQSDPLSAEAKGTVSIMLMYQRRYADALAKGDEAVALERDLAGSHAARQRALAGLGRLGESVEAVQQVIRLSGGRPAVVAELGRLYALMGRRPEAEAILARISRPERATDYADSEDAAYIQIALGRRAQALAALERAVDQHSERMLWLRVDPRVDALRGEPRFQRLVQRTGGLP